jgi:hypothetical protein
VQNLSTLNLAEIELLVALLRSNETRFHVSSLVTEVRSLMNKNILFFQTRVDFNEWICTLNPLFVKDRVQLAEHFEKQLVGVPTRELR